VEGETTDIIICRQLSVSKGTGPGLTISLTSYNDKILENQAKRIASAVPNINPGPDHLWCIDGHDKLVPWGIHIYAAVDFFKKDNLGVCEMRNHLPCRRTSSGVRNRCGTCSEETINAGSIGIGSPETLAGTD
jgi:hypothetical protein